MEAHPRTGVNDYFQLHFAALAGRFLANIFKRSTLRLRHRTVPKAALGRKLGNLMEERKTSTPSDESTALPGSISPGMATLLRGGNQAPDTPSGLFGSRSRRRLVQGSLFLADVFLAALIVGLVKIHGRLGFLGLALCVLALALGAWLACLALWLEKPEDE